jgi:aryl-alcohol dehydrogenase-like predicted oxidoreductase
MKYRKIGSTQISVSEIGFGAWGIGGNSNGAVAYGPTDDNESIRALRHAFDCGVNFFDTANFYGYGHSEKIIGKGLLGIRDKIVISTKVGMISDKGDQDFSLSHIRRSIEQSLRRLNTDYIDLYLLHSPPIDIVIEDITILKCMRQLQNEGKIREFGISVRSPEDGLKAIDLGISCIQINFNLLDQRAAENGLFDLCLEKGVGVIGRTPLCFGFLTGHYLSDDKFDTSDHRGKWSTKQLDKWANAYQLFKSALNVTEDQTPAQIALRFCISFPAISSVIPGMLTLDHVNENTQASKFGKLSESERIAIMSIYTKHNFFLSKK